MPPDEPKTASKKAWWIAMLANELTMCRREWLEPRVGDVVVETTHTIMLARHQLGLDSAIGEIIEITDDAKRGKRYLLKGVDDKLAWWENARMVVIERRRHTAEVSDLREQPKT